MKRSNRWILLIGLLFCSMMFVKPAQAASAKKLFTMVVKDGFSSYEVPVYEYKRGNGSTYVAAKKTKRSFYVYAGSKKVSVKIKDKTARYKKNYKSVNYKKTQKLSAETKLNISLQTKKGAAKSFTVKLKRPSMPAIGTYTLSVNAGQTFTSGEGKRLLIRVPVSSGVYVNTFYQIINSRGQEVYMNNLGSAQKVIFTSFWDGTASYGNQAGLHEGEYVPDGSYTCKIQLEYKVGDKIKLISKSQKFTLKNGAKKVPVSTVQTPPPVQPLPKVNWKWQVVLTGEEEVDYLAEYICQQIIKPEMTPYERALAIYTWCSDHITYSQAWDTIKTYPYKIDLESEGARKAVASYAAETKKMLANKTAAVNTLDVYFNENRQGTRMTWAKYGLGKYYGNCCVMSLAYEILGRHAGLTVEIVENTLKTGQGRHFWNVVQMDGQYYYVDVNQATAYKELSGSIHYAFFLRGSDFCFGQSQQYSTVNTKGYPIALKVSKTDYPNRTV